MHRFMLRLLLLLMAFCLNSCGIPQLLGRTINNSARQLGAMGR